MTAVQNPAIDRLADPDRSSTAAGAVRVLGEFAVTWTERVDLGPAEADLIKILAVTGERSRLRLQACLWPDTAGPAAASRLRSLLYRMRQHTGAALVRPVGSCSVQLAPELAVDYAAAGSAARDIAAGRLPEPRAMPRVVDLLARDLLPSERSEWLDPYQAAWTRNRLRALTQLARTSSRAGHWGPAVQACEVLVAAEPFNEPVHYLLLEGLARDGLHGAARALHEQLDTRLRYELGCRPALSYAAATAAGGERDWRH